MPSRVVDHDISDIGVPDAIGTKKNHSATIINEDLPRSNTISAAVEVETDGSVEAPGYVSVEGNAAQTIDKVHNQMPDKTYELVEGKKKLKHYDKSDVSSPKVYKQY